ncbi:MAG TPA: hypothetical protein VIT68_01595 [Candidatus Gracilibacteria bacterium]
MHFLLNLSLISPSLALVENDKIITFEAWEGWKESSQVIWDWVAAHKSQLENLKSIRTITGPGGFSSLRVCGLICETLADKYQCELRTVRADRVGQQLLEDLGLKEPLLLNAFGDNVFEVASDEKALNLIPLEQAQDTFQENVFIDFLPPAKQVGFLSVSTQKINPKLILEALFEASQDAPPVTSFVPYYGHPGV